ncbi:MAG: hypothetical protein AAFQ98_10120 [Bacteroidota bacterium]
MANSTLDFMKDVLAAPLGELISSIGNGVAEAQAALDASSITQYLALYGDGDDETARRLRQIGYQPTFYTIPETEVEAQVSLSISAKGTSVSGSGPAPVGARTSVYVTPMNGRATNQYNLDVASSATLKFKIVPVPPPAGSEEMRVAPNLLGKKMPEVEAILGELGISFTLKPDKDGNPPEITSITKVDQQFPVAGEVFSNTIPMELVVIDDPFGES